MKTPTAFAPVLKIPNGITDVSFYKNAFGVAEHFCLTNDDGSIHVAEFDIDGAIFHLHEETYTSKGSSPLNAGTVTATIGLFTDDVQTIYEKAIAAGAIPITPVTDYDYGYRQGDLQDPFGHVWTIQKQI